MCILPELKNTHEGLSPISPKYFITFLIANLRLWRFTQHDKEAVCSDPAGSTPALLMTPPCCSGAGPAASCGHPRAQKGHIQPCCRGTGCRNSLLSSCWDLNEVNDRDRPFSTRFCSQWIILWARSQLSIFWKERESCPVVFGPKDCESVLWHGEWKAERNGWAFRALTGREDWEQHRLEAGCEAPQGKHSRCGRVFWLSPVCMGVLVLSPWEVSRRPLSPTKPRASWVTGCLCVVRPVSQLGCGLPGQGLASPSLWPHCLADWALGRAQ